MELVEGSQTEWKKEAESHYLPKVEMIDWVYLEPIPSKNTADVLHAVGKMYAAARSEGFDVRRLHSDRGKEFFNNPMKVWCTRHGIHKTYALPEEHQSNGRAEGAIMRVKAKIRTILHSSGCSKEEWPLAGRLAAHALRNSARQRLNMPTLPSVPYNSKVQVLQRSWTRGVWESLTLTAHTKAPSGDSSRGWIVKTTDGRLLTTGVLFPAPLLEKDVEVTYKSNPVPVSEPERRIRGKTTLKAMQALPCEAASSCSFDDLECLAREHLERQAFELEPALQVLSKARQCMPSASQQVWKQKIGGSEHDGTVGLTTPTRSHPWFSRYVSLLFAHHTSCPVACVEIQWGGELAMRPRKSYQPGTRCAVLSLSARCQVHTRDVTSHAANQHCSLLQARCAEAGQWKSVHGGLDQDVFLVGYTPKGLHKLSQESRYRLLATGVTCLPCTQQEHWSLSYARGLLCRHHVTPRRGAFRLHNCANLPLPRDWLGRICLEDRVFADGSNQRGLAWCTHPLSPSTSARWTGVTVFQIKWPTPAPQVLGGGSLCKHSATVATAEGLQAQVAAAEGLQAQVAAAEGLHAQVAAAEGLQAQVATAEGLQVQVATAEGLHAQVAAAEGLQAQVATAEGLQAQVAAAEGLQAQVAAAEGLQAQVATAEGLHAQVAAAEGLQAQVATAEGLQVQVATAEGLQAQVAAAEGLQVQVATAEGLQAQVATAEGLQAQVAAAEGLQAQVATAEGLHAQVAAAEGLQAQVATAEGLQVQVATAEGLQVQVATAEGLQAQVVAAEGLQAQVATACSGCRRRRSSGSGCHRRRSSLSGCHRRRSSCSGCHRRRSSCSGCRRRRSSCSGCRRRRSSGSGCYCRRSSSGCHLRRSSSAEGFPQVAHTGQTSMWDFRTTVMWHYGLIPQRISVNSPCQSIEK